MYVLVSSGIGSFEASLKEDFEKLCIYDCLLKIDIKEFYGRIYTHLLGMGDNERYFTDMNTGATNGLIMGNYLSLYWAEKHLSNISRDLEAEFRENSCSVMPVFNSKCNRRKE